MSLEENKSPYYKLPLAESSYKMRPSLHETFKASKVKQVIQGVLTSKLQGRVYSAEMAKQLIPEIADTVNATIKNEVPMPRYKHVVQVVLGQQLGAGCRYIAKCCWDAECDSQTSDVFTNTSLFCICTVFGIYLY